MQQVGLGHKPHQVPHILNAPTHPGLTLLQGDALGGVGSLGGAGGGGRRRRWGGGGKEEGGKEEVDQEHTKHTQHTQRRNGQAHAMWQG
jgi:hypothetical protein